VILQAATRILERQSLAGLTTNRVAEVAGVSVGSVYQYFPNKAALVAALVERAQATLRNDLAAVIDACRDVPLVEALRAVARLAVRQQYANPLLAAALDEEERRLPLEDVLRRADTEIAGLVGVLLDRYRNDLAPDLPANAARDCLMITRTLVEADVQSPSPPAADLEERIVRALLGYLCVAP